MSKKRKLLPEKTMIDVCRLLDLGVPMKRIIRDKELIISAPTLAKLADYYRKEDCAMHLSLFPDWLKDDSSEQPDTVEYHGFFPLGQWLPKCKNSSI